MSYFFGMDDYGRDYLMRVLYGGWVLFVVGFFVMVVFIIIGIVVGIISGYFGGKLDNFLMWVVEVFMLILLFFLMLLLNVYLKLGIMTLVFIIGLLIWMDIVCIVRVEMLFVKECEYVLYVKVLG